MIYIIFEDREGGCSCSPVYFREIEKILVKGGEERDLDLLRREYYDRLNQINSNAYVKRRNFGNFSEWLIREKGFKEAEFRSISF